MNAVKRPLLFVALSLSLLLITIFSTEIGVWEKDNVLISLHNVGEETPPLTIQTQSHTVDVAPLQKGEHLRVKLSEPRDSSAALQLGETAADLDTYISRGLVTELTVCLDSDEVIRVKDSSQIIGRGGLRRLVSTALKRTCA